MDLLKSFRGPYLKASSMLESILTISIISICVLVGTITFVKVFETGNSINFYKAKYKMSELLLEAPNKGFFKNELYDFELYQIEKEIEDYDNNPFVKRVVFTIELANKKKKYSYIIKYQFED